MPKSLLIAALPLALFTAPTTGFAAKETAAGKEAIETCYSTAADRLQRSRGHTLLADRGLRARATSSGWRVSGDVLMLRFSTERVVELTCEISGDRVSVSTFARQRPDGT